MARGIIEIASGLIAGCGIFTNTLSLSYFIIREKAGLMTRLLILLNSLDLAVCVTATVVKLLYWYTRSADVYYRSINALYKLSLEGTALATCLLSVTRTLALCCPFNLVNQKAVAISTIVYLSYLLVKHTAILLMYYYCTQYEDKDIAKVAGYIQLAALVVMLLIVVVSNILTVSTLLMRKRPESRRTSTATKIAIQRDQKASTTVLILSLIFCFFNMLYMTYYVIKYARIKMGYEFHAHLHESGTAYFLTIVQKIAYFIAVPLNSAVNPVVYFVRRLSMRLYFKEVWEGVWRRCCVVCCKGRELVEAVPYSRVEHKSATLNSRVSLSPDQQTNM